MPMRSEDREAFPVYAEYFDAFERGDVEEAEAIIDWFGGTNRNFVIASKENGHNGMFNYYAEDPYPEELVCDRLGVSYVQMQKERNEYSAALIRRMTVAIEDMDSELAELKLEKARIEKNG